MKFALEVGNLGFEESHSRESSVLDSSAGGATHQPNAEADATSKSSDSDAAMDSSLKHATRFQRESTQSAMIIQTEPWAEDNPAYISLSSDDLTKLSEVMTDLLESVGVKKGDRILIYDYNTSLSTLVMSRVFAPGLESGVCERLGCTAICNDGLSELASRCAYVYNTWKPDVLLIRSDVLSPFVSKLKKDGIAIEDNPPRLVIVIHSDSAPMPRLTSLGHPNFDFSLLYRVDPALFMCIIKPCGGLYFPSKYYDVSLARLAEGGAAHPESKYRKLSLSPIFSSAHEMITTTATRTSTITSSLDCIEGPTKCKCGQSHKFRTDELRS